jgi:hypothetical protein
MRAIHLVRADEGHRVRRRDFLEIIAGAAALRPLVAVTQQKEMPLITFLTTAPIGKRAGASSPG